MGAVLRLVKAMPLLAAGQTLETLALNLGWGSAPSFVSMFKRMVGGNARQTPQVLRPEPPCVSDQALATRPDQALASANTEFGVLGRGFSCLGLANTPFCAGRRSCTWKPFAFCSSARLCSVTVFK